MSISNKFGKHLIHRKRSPFPSRERLFRDSEAVPQRKQVKAPLEMEPYEKQSYALLISKIRKFLSNITVGQGLAPAVSESSNCYNAISPYQDKWFSAGASPCPTWIFIISHCNFDFLNLLAL